MNCRSSRSPGGAEVRSSASRVHSSAARMSLGSARKAGGSSLNRAPRLLRISNTASRSDVTSGASAKVAEPPWMAASMICGSRAISVGRPRRCSRPLARSFSTFALSAVIRISCRWTTASPHATSCSVSSSWRTRASLPMSRCSAAGQPRRFSRSLLTWAMVLLLRAASASRTSPVMLLTRSSSWTSGARRPPAPASPAPGPEASPPRVRLRRTPKKPGATRQSSNVQFPSTEHSAKVQWSLRGCSAKYRRCSPTGTPILPSMASFSRATASPGSTSTEKGAAWFRRTCTRIGAYGIPLDKVHAAMAPTGGKGCQGGQGQP
mmetsp:Transcript_14473/g.46371  ORF Transcript_14473/g.46371 Transcript_14473/m.46371 type:complete len:321 (-) Transcript_14473:7-969(-)